MAGVSTTNSSNTADADGSTTVFNFTFFVYSTDDIKVYSVLDDVLTPITTGITKAINTSFIGGTVTFATAPLDAVGDILIRREVPYTQTTEFADITRYKETAIESALNTIVLQSQQIAEDVALCLKFNETSGVTDPTIEEPVDGALLSADGVTGRVKFVTAASLGTAIDTLFSGLAANDFLKYNGSFWVNRTPAQVADDVNALLRSGGTMTGALNEAKGADIASASTINLTTATGNLVDVTGTTTITAITLAEGAQRVVRFTGALTLTHGASLVLPNNGSNITTAAGDFAVFRGYSGGVVRCVSYTRASGQALASTASSFKVGSFTRDLSTATGSQAITGVGFQPSAVIMFGGNTGNSWSTFIGAGDGSTSGSFHDNGPVSGGSYSVTSDLMKFIETGANNNVAALSSLDSDGFTLGWTKTGSPTGTATIKYIAFR